MFHHFFLKDKKIVIIPATLMHFEVLLRIYFLGNILSFQKLGVFFGKLDLQGKSIDGYVLKGKLSLGQ